MMGQEKIYVFLKNHRGKTFSAKELARLTNSGMRSVYGVLERLEADKAIVSNQARVGNTNHFTKLYSYVDIDGIDELYEEMQQLKNKMMLSGEIVSSLMVIREIRKLREVLNGESKN